MIPKFAKYLDLALLLKDEPTLYHKHFSFIIKKNRLRAIGWNSLKTHPLAAKIGYEYHFVHSELSAITRFDGRPTELTNCVLINIRINKLGKILNSKPCVDCVRLIDTFGIKQVFYTNKLGIFEEL